MKKTLFPIPHPPPTALYLTIAVTVLLSYSCSLTERLPEQRNTLDSELIAEIKNNLPETICIFNPEEYFFTGTKSTSALPVEISGSALDYSSISTRSDSLSDYFQIPIHAPQTPLSSAHVTFPTSYDATELSEETESKSFLIVQNLKDTTLKLAYTITLIPHPDYMTQGQLDSLNVFYDGFFNAIAIYSDLQGHVFRVEIYIHGIIWKSGHIATVPPDYSDTVIATISPKRTRTYDGGELNTVIIVADRLDKNWNDWRNNDPGHPSNNDYNWPKSFLDHVTMPFISGLGWSGGDARTYSVIIEKQGRGVVTGGGRYNEGSLVYITAAPEYVGDIATSEFISWSGYISSTSPVTTFTVRKEPLVIVDPTIHITANFHDFNPCADEDSDRRDPLSVMKIQGSGENGWNIKGGTYGWVRKELKDNRLVDKHHDGMDFACPIGTPVHSTHKGRVTAIRKDVLPGEDYSEYDARGGRDCPDERIFKAGNAIEILCHIQGSAHTIKYYHLTDIFVEVGQTVEAGDIIGTSGITGNGGSKGSGGPHLHYQVHDSSGKTVDPKDFIYSKFNSKYQLTNPCD